MTKKDLERLLSGNTIQIKKREIFLHENGQKLKEEILEVVSEFFKDHTFLGEPTRYSINKLINPARFNRMLNDELFLLQAIVKRKVIGATKITTRTFKCMTFLEEN